MPKILLATLCLNEMEWLPRLYEQHKNWPGLVGWCFVESADKVYAEANPRLVNNCGLSTDDTSHFLEELALMNDYISYVPKGFSTHADPAQGKCESRNCYLDVAERIEPDFVIVLDADEFYTKADQARIHTLLEEVLTYNMAETSYLLKQRHIWHPDVLMNLGKPAFDLEVVGGYWGVPHCRIWKFIKGMRYINNHNIPRYITNVLANSQMARFDLVGIAQPQCIHMGFASGNDMRAAKHRYYEARGEGRNDNRQKYVDCRHAYETWKPGDRLPHEARVIKYQGPIPEVFLPRPYSE